MKIKAVCEYNELGFLIFAIDYPGAYVRGTTENEALAKFGGELRSYFRWLGTAPPDTAEVEIVQRRLSERQMCDADTDVLFDSERIPLSGEEYELLKLLVLKSARDFHTLYCSISHPDISGRPLRRTFYGTAPRTPRQMYEHVNRFTAHYASAIGLRLENMPDLYVNRMHLLSELEEGELFLSDRVYTAANGEEWTVRKLLRRLHWHDRIHAKAMWRTATSLWGDEIKNPFYFV